MNRSYSHRFLDSCRALFVAASVLITASVSAAELDLVNIRTVDPTIAVELRYATVRNIAQRPLYPTDMPAFVRPSVAQKLAVAQNYLRERGYGIKIWDAYRPKSAHEQLWQYSKNNDYVADPADGRGSLHTWGVAVDATLVDKDGREMQMPTDFDNFTPAAMLYYKGADPKIRRNVHRLQSAMAIGGFYGLRTEWWHFVAKDWQAYRAILEIVVVPRSVAGAAPMPEPLPRGQLQAPGHAGSASISANPSRQ